MQSRVLMRYPPFRTGSNAR